MFGVIHLQKVVYRQINEEEKWINYKTKAKKELFF
jgi:hypothetical protein